MRKSEYWELLKPIVAKYRQHGYSFWRSRVGGEPITFEDATAHGTEYQVEIDAIWDGKADGDIRVMFSIDDGGWRAYCPVCDDFIIAPDGRFVGE